MPIKQSKKTVKKTAKGTVKVNLNPTQIEAIKTHIAKKISKKRLKRNKKVVSEEQKEQRKHRNDIRTLFKNTGFERIVGANDREFEFKGRKSDFDDVYRHQNILIFTEYTTASSVSDHLLKKKVIYDHILNDCEGFVEYYANLIPEFKAAIASYYTAELKIFILYCSKNQVKDEHKAQVPNIKFFDYYVVEYFKSLTSIIRLSARFEIFQFLGINYRELGENISPSSQSTLAYKGSLLPDSYSNFSKGYRVISFYIDPKSLIEKSYVLRKYGWQDEYSLYQRMIQRGKINQIRRYLNTEERVFINNIIVTLPNTTKLLDNKGHTINPQLIKQTQPVEISIENNFNVIGIIDGQHRVFAYHEGGEHEAKIKVLREKQNLLVTGIIYPDTVSDKEKLKFEAKIFLEINANQSNARSNLKQAIGQILHPFNSESICRAVLERLNKKGALEALFELNYFDRKKIKTTSIVSYGLKPLLKLSGTDSLFGLWAKANKDNLIKNKDEQLLEEYISYCTTEINAFLAALRQNLGKNWHMTNTKKDNGGILNTTTVNGFFICLRKLIESGKTGDIGYYKSQTSSISNVKFLNYKSSQYGNLGDKIFKTYF